MKLNVGCGEYYVDGWCNLDVVRTELIKPDLLVLPEVCVWPINDNKIERVYCGHVLEHVPWEHVPAFLAEVRRVLVPGGDVCVVGPDVWRTIAMWRELGDDDPDSIEYDPTVRAVLEDDEHYQPREQGTEEWPGARHAWNCYEARVVRALTQAYFIDVEPVPVTAEALSGWPVLSFIGWQCAAIGRAPW